MLYTNRHLDVLRNQFTYTIPSCRIALYGLGLFLISCFVGCNQNKENAIAAQKIQAKTILRTLEIVANDFEHEPSKLGGIEKQFANQVNLAFGDNTLDVDQSDPSSHLFLDPWGNTITYALSQEKNKIIRLCSNGPNGIWENGLGDDVVLDVAEHKTKQ